jgi:hypothetical protein
MFPYHPADSVYMAGRDYYLDVSLDPAAGHFIGGSPHAVNSIYKLVSFLNPTSNQLYASNVGDVYESGDFRISAYDTYYYLDTIITKTVLPHSIIYTYSGLQGGYDINFVYHPVSYYDGTFTTNDSTYLFNSQMPEEMLPVYSSNSCNYYFPDDSSWCSQSPLYKSGWIFGEDGRVFTNKVSFGQTDYIDETGDPYYEDRKLIYTYKSGISCGTYDTLVLPSSTPILTIQNSLTISPNPATTSLTIQSTNEPITQLTITNLLGQTLYCHPMFVM